MNCAFLLVVSWWNLTNKLHHKHCSAACGQYISSPPTTSTALLLVVNIYLYPHHEHCSAAGGEYLQQDQEQTSNALGGWPDCLPSISLVSGKQSIELDYKLYNGRLVRPSAWLFKNRSWLARPAAWLLTIYLPCILLIMFSALYHQTTSRQAVLLVTEKSITTSTACLLLVLWWHHKQQTSSRCCLSALGILMVGSSPQADQQQCCWSAARPCLIFMY